MKNPFAIWPPGLPHASAPVEYRRTPESVEVLVLARLRAGIPYVRVDYLRRPLVIFVAPGAAMPTALDWLSRGTAVVTIPDSAMLAGEAAYNAREAAWRAAGAPTDGAGMPIYPRSGTPILDRINAEVAKLGPDAKPLPRGKARRKVVEILIGFGLTESAALGVLDEIEEYLK